MAERQGIEIDYCPQCRGVWLDRGELDKIIERSVAGGPAGDAPRSRASEEARGDRGRYDREDDRDRRHEDDRRHDDHHDGDDRHRHGRRRRGFLGDIFDFD